jgi:hypothetical protein
MPVGASAFLSMTRPALTAVAEFNGKLLDTAAKVNAEWADFLGRRLQADLALSQRLVACKSPQEAQQVCLHYWKTAFSQYQDEMGRLAKMSETCARETASTIRNHAQAISQETQIAA